MSVTYKVLERISQLFLFVLDQSFHLTNLGAEKLNVFVLFIFLIKLNLPAIINLFFLVNSVSLIIPSAITGYQLAVLLEDPSCVEHIQRIIHPALDVLLPFSNALTVNLVSCVLFVRTICTPLFLRWRLIYVRQSV